jgi:hypothetical protein
MRTAPALVLLGVVLLALTACVPDGDPVIPDPLPTSTPIFASDEEALAAAEEAFAAYLEVVDAILADGGIDSDRLATVATEDVVTQDEEGFAETRDLQHRSTGATAFDSLTLQQFDGFAADGVGVVTVYVCEDFSGKDVLDAQGQSIVAPDRRTRWPLVVGFDSKSSHEPELLVSSVEDWTGADFCVD